jgi:hypothetical protein
VGGALFAGYVAFGLTFTVHYSTHDYYHLPLVVGLAVGVGLLADRLVPILRGIGLAQAAPRLGAAVAVIVVLSLRFGPISPIPPPIPAASIRAEVEVPKEVRAAIGNSTNVILLAPSCGFSLAFYGAVARPSWPGAADDRPGSADEVTRVFEELTAGTSPRYFVVTNMDEWHDQPELRSFLADRYPVLVQRADLVIFNLQS